MPEALIRWIDYSESQCLFYVPEGTTVGTCSQHMRCIFDNKKYAKIIFAKILLKKYKRMLT